jgi:serine/threonine-protein kinase
VSFDAPALLEPGARLDRYELLCLLAQGGMANVWLARTAAGRGARKLFAIKTILPHAADDPAFKAMFLDEARIASRIQHANVIRMVEVGEHNSTPYQVMDLVEGQPLHRLVRTCERLNRKMPLGIQLRVLADACQGLHAAHEVSDENGRPLQIVHRDVSPQNILLATNGVAKIIDFGVAKAIDRSADKTNAGTLKGKVNYMPHEQASGRDVDRRTDTWALGAVLYWMLVGRAPYKEETELATLKRAMRAPPIPPLPDAIPLPLNRLVMRALAREPGDRFQTAAEMGEAIEGLTQSLGIAMSHDDVGQFLCHVMVEELDAQRQRVRHAITEATKRDHAAAGSDAAFGDDTTDETPRPSYEALIAMTRKRDAAEPAEAAPRQTWMSDVAPTTRIAREDNPHYAPKSVPSAPQLFLPTPMSPHEARLPMAPVPPSNAVIVAAPIAEPGPITEPDHEPTFEAPTTLRAPVSSAAPLSAPAPFSAPAPPSSPAPVSGRPTSPFARTAPMNDAPWVPPPEVHQPPPDATAGALVVPDRPSLRPLPSRKKARLAAIAVLAGLGVGGLVFFRLHTDEGSTATRAAARGEVSSAPPPVVSHAPVATQAPAVVAAPPPTGIEETPAPTAAASSAPAAHAPAPRAPVPPPPPTETTSKPTPPPVTVTPPRPVIVRRPNPTPTKKSQSRDDEAGF